MSILPGEGERKIVARTRIRVECDQCGEPATKRHTYLLPNARRNPASSAFGRDDCSWCSDHEVFRCNTCEPQGGSIEPSVEGYGWCSTFEAVPRFAHMFLRWDERPYTPSVEPASLMDEEAL
jgi:hypothetical protein